MHPTDQLNAALAGRYRIESLAGEGGMASVYLARDLRHDRPVALKALEPELASAVGVERFLREIRVSANLQHPNLLPLFDSGEADGQLFYVMPFAEGETLRARLDREGQLPIDEAIHIVTGIASGLEYAHRRGVVHRDLKPGNILLQAGQPLIADFGIALAVHQLAGERITGSRVSLGTAEYMSPEQAAGDRVIDARSDIYSLAVIAFEMLAGEPPHTGRTTQAVLAKVLNERPWSVRSTRPNVPDHVERAIARGLEKVPADRWASARDFADALTGNRSSPVPGSITLVRSPRMRRRLQVIGGAAAVAVFGAGGARLAMDRWYSAPAHRMMTMPIERPHGAPATTHLVAKAHLRLALSRDGGRVAMVERDGDDNSLFVRELADFEFRRLPGTAGASAPAFSPDGEELLFVAGGKLKTIKFTGGEPTVLTDAQSAADWTDANEIIYTNERSLWRIGARGGTPRLLASPDAARGHIAYEVPRVLPDGRRALVGIARTNGHLNATMGYIDLTTGAVTELGIRALTVDYIPDDAKSGYLVTGFAKTVSASRLSLTDMSHGDPVPVIRGVDTEVTFPWGTAFACSRSGTVIYDPAVPEPYRLMRVTLEGIATPIDSARPNIHWPRLSPDGRFVALDQEGHIWVVDQESRSWARLTDRGNNSRPEWTRDGTRLVYMHADTSEFEGTRVDSRRVGGTGPPEVFLPPVASGGADVDFGRRGNYYAVRHGNNVSIWLGRLDSLPAHRPVLHGSNPALSPDGKFIAFTRRVADRDEVFISPIPGVQRAVQVSTDGGGEPIWSPNGNTLYYRGPTHFIAARLATDGDGLRVLSRQQLFEDVYRRSAVRNEYDIYPDGKSFLVLKPERTAPPSPVVIANLTEKLAKLLPRR